MFLQIVSILCFVLEIFGTVSCRFGCVHLEISSPREAGGKRVKIKKKGWPRVLSARFQPIISEELQKDDMEAEEAACNENPHVFMPRRDHPFEGMSHPTPQVTLRCNCDVKYLGRGIDQEDFENLIKAHSTDIRSVVRRVVVDMTRDMMDVQFYTGEYASKKFEVARDMLPELHQGLDRLKKQLEEEKEAAGAETAQVVMDDVAPVSKRPLRLGGGQFCFVSAVCF